MPPVLGCCLLKHLHAGATAEREERVYLVGSKTKSSSTVSALQTCHLPGVCYIALTQLPTSKLENLIFLREEEEENEIGIGKTQNVVSSMTLKDMFWETRKEERARMFLANGIERTRG